MASELERRWDEIGALPRLGWVESPSPVTVLEPLARRLGLGWLAVKRDDLIPELHGSTKVRKLDYLLAAAPWAEATTWASAGAIGSGHLVALAGAAQRLGRRLEAHLFWEPPSATVLENLAHVATQAASLHYYESRIGLTLRSPRLVLGGRGGARAIIEPGATNGAGMTGLVRAGLELARQIEAGELPPLDRIVVPVGSGGTLAGLMVGLALAGLRVRVQGVTVVEAPLATRARILRLTDGLRRRLATQGIACTDLSLPELELDRAQLGRGYGVATPASLAAVATLHEQGLAGEAIYSGKGFAALLARPPMGERVLFWLTPRREDPLPCAPAWREALPWRLRRRLLTGRPVGRRAFVIGALATAAIVARCGCRPELEHWRGRALAAGEAHTLLAVAEAVLPDGEATLDVVVAADRYLEALPPASREGVAMALRLVEQAPLWLGFGAARVGGLAREPRRAYLVALSEAGGIHTRAYRAARDLCMVGYYQQPRAWPAIGYDGPLVGAELRADAYDRLRAPVGALPRGFVARRS